MTAALRDIRRGMGCRLAANRHKMPVEDVKAAARKAGLGGEEHAKAIERPPIRFRWRRRRVRFRLKGPIPPVARR